jgi:SEC-C motif-containing protein
MSTDCPCGSGAPYTACCGKYLEDGAQPEKAEQLMRSRYTAYVLTREEYLWNTWHASTRPAQIGLEAGNPVQWQGLTIQRTEAGTSADSEGVVEFVARYKVNGKAGCLQETSRFLKENGQWFYVDGRIHE